MAGKVASDNRRSDERTTHLLLNLTRLLAVLHVRQRHVAGQLPHLWSKNGRKCIALHSLQPRVRQFQSEEYCEGSEPPSPPPAPLGANHLTSRCWCAMQRFHNKEVRIARKSAVEIVQTLLSSEQSLRNDQTIPLRARRASRLETARQRQRAPVPSQ